MVALFALALWLLWRRPALISRWIPILAKEGTALHSQTERVRALEQEVYTFASRRPAALAAAMTCEGLFHALGVVEAYITLQVITDVAPGVLTAFILETAQRLMAVALQDRAVSDGRRRARDGCGDQRARTGRDRRGHGRGHPQGPDGRVGRSRRCPAGAAGHRTQQSDERFSRESMSGSTGQ